VWHNLVAYLFLYYTLSLVYRFALDEGGKVSITKKHVFVELLVDFFRTERVCERFRTCHLLISKHFVHCKSVPLWSFTLVMYL
jgi:hypothetical protein